MSITYFLGANSRHGFYSLYDSFPPGETTVLHIIKGGPGNGKSGFMRRLASAAEDQGLEVEYVLCSGDPDSLDGIYIPALNAAWCDGTAPHVTEPVIFGVTSDYVNLGSFCRLPLSEPDAQRIRQLNREYKALYSRAYGHLSAAASLWDASRPSLLGQEELTWIRKRVNGILDRELSQVPAKPAISSSRFFSAISCQGEVKLGIDIYKLCKLVYAFDDGLGAASSALDIVRQEAEARGAALILAPDPLDPARLSAVLLPGCSLAFVAGNWDLPDTRHIRIDSLPEPQAAKAARHEQRRAQRLYAAAIAQAIGKLGQAKALHDELEAVYKPYMDFAALDTFTTAQIKQYIG